MKKTNIAAKHLDLKKKTIVALQTNMIMGGGPISTSCICPPPEPIWTESCPNTVACFSANDRSLCCV
ncbi:hypothetical protein [Taibaiella koreensis]|uniref:hypothetical protein n=1 Tax=Taibaiella koreensis TaxID=1268548 RepID=UPI0013C2E5AC|nr:hypothetical protein [Taibaiella koreensis]